MRLDTVSACRFCLCLISFWGPILNSRVTGRNYNENNGGSSNWSVFMDGTRAGMDGWMNGWVAGLSNELDFAGVKQVF